MQAERTINNNNKSNSHNLTMGPLGINNNFRDYYKLLYKSECTENRDAQNTFLNQLQFPTISDDDKIDRLYRLDSPLTKKGT